LHSGPGMMQSRSSSSDPDGFTLVEVLVALGLLTSALIAIAQLCAVAAHDTLAARHETFASVLAAQKMEELTAAIRPAVSPPGTLVRDTPGFVEFLDEFGHTVGIGPSPPDGSLYLRRWSVEPLASDPDRTLVVQVLVTAARWRMRDPSSFAGSAPGDVRLTTLVPRSSP